MKKYFTQCIAVLILLVSHSFAIAADEDSVKVTDDKVSLNFVDADIESVVKAIGQITNKNFLLDPRVKGTISINTAKPVPRAITYQILLSALRVQGFATVEENGYTSIVPEVDAKGKFTPRMTSGKQSGGQIVTQVYVLKYENASQLVNIVKPLLSPNSVINAYPGSNALIVTDYADNLNKIVKLIESIDKPSQAENVLVRLKFASAVEITQTINRLMADSNTNAEPSKRILAVADARSNAIILHAENQSLIARAASLIEQLDVPTNAGSSIHVVYLKNADSTKLASTLRALMSGKAAESTLAPSVTATPMAQPTTAADAAKASAIPQSAAQATASPFSPLASSQENGMIQADPATNSLLITASDQVFNMLRGVIDKLDVRRAQLYIEALIAEVSTDKASEFGIQWQDLEAFKDSTMNKGNVQGFGGTNFNRGGNIKAVAGNIGAAGSGFNLGILKGRVNIPGIGQVTNLGVLAHALESNANANILSKPNLLMLDNEEAKIVIGQNVPFVTGSYAQTGGTTVTPFQTIERQDVGLTLKVKPQISEGNTIKLQIHQEVSSVSDAAGSAGITTNKRAIDTSVLVDDGSIIVLGGLIEDRISDTVDKVPFFGDLPLVGALFRSVGRVHKKTNLMVFLRPYVMRSAEDTAKVSNERYDYIIQQQIAITPTKVWPLPEMPVVTLPDRFERSLATEPSAK